MTQALHTSQLTNLPIVRRGKVRDIYSLDDDKLLIVQSDRISAFDVIMNEPIPQKGTILTNMSLFWFERLKDIVTNHLLGTDVNNLPLSDDEKTQVANRSMVVKKLQPLPIEAVCRGYLIGSGWKDYCQSGSVCGIPLPKDLRLAQKLPEVIFTPATKAKMGEHDENISYQTMCDLISDKTANKVRQTTLALYQAASDYALSRGIIIADTKFEFALEANELILIDEVLTPDSSRFWPTNRWQAGKNPDSFDKQFLRDWLETTHWNKKAPPPTIPEDIIAHTSQKYQDIQSQLMT